VIRISPVVRGAKSKYLGLIIGVALVVLTWGAGAVGLAGVMGAGVGIGSLTVGSIVGGIGISMALGGVANLISPQPSSGGSGDNSGHNSHLFNGPQTTTQQGGPVPLCYGGPLIIG
jgi:predicted phage tail protein